MKRTTAKVGRKTRVIFISLMHARTSRGVMNAITRSGCSPFVDKESDDDDGG